jgi:hypothetical protein
LFVRESSSRFKRFDGTTSSRKVTSVLPQLQQNFGRGSPALTYSLSPQAVQHDNPDPKLVRPFELKDDELLIELARIMGVDDMYEAKPQGQGTVSPCNTAN